MPVFSSYKRILNYLLTLLNFAFKSLPFLTVVDRSTGYHAVIFTTYEHLIKLNICCSSIVYLCTANNLKWDVNNING